MKIAIVAEALETHSGSRAEVELAKQLVKLGNEVSFYAHRNPSTKQGKLELEKEKVRVILIKSPPVKFFGKFIGGLKLSKVLKKDKPQIISAHTTLPLLFGAKLSGIKIASTYYGTQQDVWLDKIFPKTPSAFDEIINRFLNLVIKIIAFIQLSIPDKIITQTEFCAKELKKLYGKKAPVIFWGDAPPHIRRIKTPPTKKGGIHLLSVSRIVPYKGFHLLIDLVKELNSKFDLNFTIIGSHPEKKYLSYLNKTKSKNIKILVNPEDTILAQNYQKCDIYLTCDKFLFFGQPILEAAYFSKPTIALNYASAKEIVLSGKTGIVAQDLIEFKKALIALIKNPKQREKLGKNAQKFAKVHSWENSAADYNQYLQKWAEE